MNSKSRETRVLPRRAGVRCGWEPAPVPGFRLRRPDARGLSASPSLAIPAQP